MPQKPLILLCAVALALTSCSAHSTVQAQTTQYQYLSGKDKDTAVPWQFFCTSGANSQAWTTINVPSNWELQGFGKYEYGVNLPAVVPSIQGQYKDTFTVPAAWSGLRVFLVFEGSMTDTAVQVNGTSAGPTHQGGYTRFQYEVSSLLKFGQSNELDVAVDNESTEATVNNAERRGDYWDYSGIYRPVYLEAVPQQYIDRVAIDAEDNGKITAQVFTGGATVANTISGQVENLNGTPVGAPFTAPLNANGAPVGQLTTTIQAPNLWTAETPNLYQLKVSLLGGNTVIHTTTTRFGFRTIELRPGQGIYVNGRKILLKGTNRHTFWPDSGRCTSEAISRQDILLMKGMNMNAVRMSHYPPDQHFLDDCDSLGLYVLDELPGWQHAYDTSVGTGMVKEMVVRDVNHPSILFWDNGNEGGWNTALDSIFPQWDPQQRVVMHPGGNIPGLIDQHYPTYSKVQTYAAGSTVFLPTEFQHGLYDGGAGAGLASYWNVIRQSPICAGGFIWAFLDEAVKRVDEGGILDTKGNEAPDGIVGPYRQKEASYDTIRSVWAPIVLGPKGLPANFTGNVPIENRYDFLNAKQCTFKWSLVQFAAVNAKNAGYTILAKGSATVQGSIPPGTSGFVHIPLPAKWLLSEALTLAVYDPSGIEINNWVWPLPHSNDFRTIPTRSGLTQTTAVVSPSTVEMACGSLAVQISKTTGMLVSVKRGSQTFSLANGPRLAYGSSTLTGIQEHADGTDYVVACTYTGTLQSVVWRLHGNGWLQLDYNYNQTGPMNYFGASFDYPETNVLSARWFGMGPYRTYKNRLDGGVLGVWSNTYNDTITGDSLWDYPEFKGYFAQVRWAQLQTTEGPITVAVGDDNTYLQLLVPKFPSPQLAGNTIPPFPTAGLSFLDGIPPMGNKFMSANQCGPDGQSPVALGAYQKTVSFYFGQLPSGTLKP